MALVGAIFFLSNCYVGDQMYTNVESGSFEILKSDKCSTGRLH